MKRNIVIVIGIVVIVVVGLAVSFIKVKRTPPPAKIDPLTKEVQARLDENDLVGAQTLLAQEKEKLQDPEALKALTAKIEDINMRILFSPVIDACSAVYEVKPNDVLINIAKTYGTTVELIKRANNLTSDMIRPGQKLKVNTCKFSLAVDKSLNYLFLKQNDKVIKSYLVSTGKDSSTPVGTFKIVNKLKDPPWFKAGAVVPPDSPQNILGTRWLGFDNPGYGIHGNRDESEIGKQVTQGCVRMYNNEVEELYDIVPVGTEVVIVE